MVNPRRRVDDPRPDVTPEAADEFFASLPQVIADLKAVDASLEAGRLRNQARDQRIMGMILLLFIAFLVVAIALERAISSGQAEFQETCQAINQNARAINKSIDTAIESIGANDAYTLQQKQSRVASWEAIRQKVPACTTP